MLLELFIFFEILVIFLFMVSFFTKQEILWAMTLVISGTLMFTSFDIEYYVYNYNQSLGAYYAVLTTHPYIYLSAINTIFFVLALILGIFDLFDKYGTRFAGKKKGEER